jgi:2,3-bisphosphoglycerate-independent phosphoglycerate mutase
MHRSLPAPRISTASSPMVRTPRSRPMAATSVSPTGQMGNSEVGHTNIGAGRIVAMDLGQIDLAIEDGDFFENAEILRFIDTLKGSGGTAHLFAVVSDGGVHGHINHALAAAKMLDGRGRSGGVHAITDGRDVPPKSAGPFIDGLRSRLPEGARIGTVIGRYFAMDRDNRWDRVAAPTRPWSMDRGGGPQPPQTP